MRHYFMEYMSIVLMSGTIVFVTWFHDFVTKTLEKILLRRSIRKQSRLRYRNMGL